MGNFHTTFQEFPQPFGQPLGMMHSYAERWLIVEDRATSLPPDTAEGIVLDVHP
jgi:hypothetical protein